MNKRAAWIKYLLPFMVVATLIAILVMIFSDSQIATRIAIILAFWSAVMGIFLIPRNNSIPLGDVGTSNALSLTNLEDKIAATLVQENMQRKRFEDTIQDQLSKISAGQQVVVNNANPGWAATEQYAEKIEELRSEVANLKNIISDLVTGPLWSELKELRAMNLSALSNSANRQLEEVSDRLTDYVKADKVEQSAFSHAHTNHFSTSNSISEAEAIMEAEIVVEPADEPAEDVPESSAQSGKFTVEKEKETDHSTGVRVADLLLGRKNQSKRRAKNKHTGTTTPEEKVETVSNSPKLTESTDNQESTDKVTTPTKADEETPSKLLLGSDTFSKVNFRPQGYDPSLFEADDFTFESLKEKAARKVNSSNNQQPAK